MDIKALREDWKKRALAGLYPAAEVDYQKVREKRQRKQSKERKLPQVSLDTRYEAIYINGRPGSGKTQLMQNLLLPDLDMVARGEAVVVVIDPTGDVEGKKPSLINVLTRLKRFAPSGDLHRKLIYIDPSDENYYLPVNLFGLQADDSARAISAVITNYIQIMDGLLKQPLTEFQDPVFRWAVQVSLGFENRTLNTLLDVLAPTPEGKRPGYEVVFDRLDPAVQRYLRRTYETSTPIGIRERLLARLESLNADPLFREMFNGSRTTVDFKNLINEPNVIVINLSAELGSMRKLFTRYFMAQLYNAGENRPANPLPCFVYIDECDLIVDDSVGEMLRRLRKKNIGLTLANQQTDRLSEDARQAIVGVAVKFASSYEESARDIGGSMGLKDGAGRVNTSFLMNRPAFNFAYHSVGMDGPITYVFEPFKMNRLPAMTDDEWGDVLQSIRERFYALRPKKTTPRAQKRSYPPQRQMEGKAPPPIRTDQGFDTTGWNGKISE